MRHSYHYLTRLSAATKSITTSDVLGPKKLSNLAKKLEIFNNIPDNDDPLKWNALVFKSRLFRQEDSLSLRKCLNNLETQALASTYSNAVNIVGDLVHKNKLGTHLSPEFRGKWISLLSQNDVSTAIAVWKLGGQASDLAIGAQLYLNAKRPRKAELIASEIEAAPEFLVRKFIRFYVNEYVVSRRTAAAIANVNSISSISNRPTNYKMPNYLYDIHRWINKWQAMSAIDVQWLHSISTAYKLELKLPKLENPFVQFPSRIQIDPKLLTGFQAINKIIVSYNLLDNKKVLSCWKASVADPSLEKLDELVSLVAKLKLDFNILEEQQLSKEEVEARTKQWAPLIRCCSASTVLKIIDTQDLTPTEYAIAINRKDVFEYANIKESVPKPGFKPRIEPDSLLDRIPISSLYSQECLTALAKVDSEKFAQIIIPPSLIDFNFEFKEIHLLSLWKSSLTIPDDLMVWLFPLTLKNIQSTRLLRCVLRNLALNNEFGKVFVILYQYMVIEKLELPNKFVSLVFTNSKKIGPPKKSKFSEQHALEEVGNTMNGIKLLMQF